MGGEARGKRSLGPMSALLPFLQVTEKVAELLKTEGSTSWQSAKAGGTTRPDLSKQGQPR